MASPLHRDVIAVSLTGARSSQEFGELNEFSTPRVVSHHALFQLPQSRRRIATAHSDNYRRRIPTARR